MVLIISLILNIELKLNLMGGSLQAMNTHSICPLIDLSPNREKKRHRKHVMHNSVLLVAIAATISPSGRAGVNLSIMSPLKVHFAHRRIPLVLNA